MCDCEDCACQLQVDCGWFVKEQCALLGCSEGGCRHANALGLRWAGRKCKYSFYKYLTKTLSDMAGPKNAKPGLVCPQCGSSGLSPPIAPLAAIGFRLIHVLAIRVVCSTYRIKHTSCRYQQRSRGVYQQNQVY